MEMHLNWPFVLSLPPHVMSSILRFGERIQILFNNLNLCESNVVQIFQGFFFARVKDNCLPTYSEKKY